MAKLTPEQRELLKALARKGLIPYTEGSAIRLSFSGGWSSKGAMEIHLATEGIIPCWDLRPDIWKDPKKESPEV